MPRTPRAREILQLLGVLLCHGAVLLVVYIASDFSSEISTADPVTFSYAMPPIFPVKAKYANWNRLEFVPPGTQPSPVAPRELCVIARTYKLQSNLTILSFVSSLAKSASRSPVKLKIIFANTDVSGEFDGLPSLVAQLNLLLASHVSTISPHNWLNIAHLFPMFNKSAENDFGFIITDLVMEDALAEPAGCDYLLITNADNLYAEQFVPTATARIDQGFDVVATHFVSRYNYTHSNVTDFLKVLDCGPYWMGISVPFRPRFKPQCIDLGAAVFTKDIVKRSRVRFMVSDLRNKPKHEYFHIPNGFRDGYFFQALAAFQANMTIIDQLLFVHQ